MDLLLITAPAYSACARSRSRVAVYLARESTMHALLILVATLAVLPASGQAQSVLEKAAADELVFMADEDPEMLRAFRRARDTLDGFLQTSKSPAPGTAHYAVKVGMREGPHTEYFWVVSFILERDDEFSGTLANAPRVVKSVREGQSFRFRKSQIVDWMYVDRAERRMHGNHTLCALLTREPPTQAAEARKRFGLTCE